ncbi:TrkH family potassium uptake protein [Bartonella sp. DGB2]|uniref:TrkH family potassium uptake protein n=1 Tax=Bartonella sp. DGB2 TaxID=3388426 RepID=UPI00398FCF83
MLLPALVDLHSGNQDWRVFVHSSIATLAVAFLVLLATQGAKQRFTPRLGFLLTTCLWLTGSLIGALPLYFSPLHLSIAQAVFESVSGITTTGATVITELDYAPRGLLLWRSLVCWIGGIGFIALALLILPSLRVGGVQLFEMESSDRSDKILPRIQQIANSIMAAYLGLTIICALSYLTAGMGLFDAINHAMTTIPTAGFSTHDASFGYFTKHKESILIVSTVFMLLSAIPFILYVKLVLPARSKNLFEQQIIIFLSIVLISSFIIATWLRFNHNLPFPRAFLTALFNFSSIITTTGYASEDYLQWGPFAWGFFFVAGFIGGCSGSTSGGIKISRMIIIARASMGHFTQLISPHAVVKLRYDGNYLSSELVQNVTLFIVLYMASLIIGTLFLCMTGLDFITAITGALTTLSNVGPGFGHLIGPAGNFATINDQALWILSFLMLAGRLELITIFILFSPAFWKNNLG